MTVFEWADRNPRHYESMLDQATRDEQNLADIRTAVSECLTESGHQSSGCSAIDSIAVQVANRIRERINFERDMGGEDDEAAEQIAEYEEQLSRAG